MDILFFAFTLMAVLSIVISIPLIAKKVKPNPYYGYRVRKTLENPEIWYPANQYLGWLLLISSLIFLVASILLYFVPGITLDGYAIGCMLAFIVPFAIGMAQSIHYLKNLS
jgi:uncharacterized membrane protein